MAVGRRSFGAFLALILFAANPYCYRFRPRTTTLRPSPLRPSDPAGFHPTLAMVASPACYGKPDPTASFDGTASHKRQRRIRKGRSFSVSLDAIPVRLLTHLLAPEFSSLSADEFRSLLSIIDNELSLNLLSLLDSTPAPDPAT